MLVLRLDYLTGRAVATAYNDRNGAEWPPHPARVFSALVATWAEHEHADNDELEQERLALQWLESLSPPSLAYEEGAARRVVTHYVPTNDVSLLSSQERGILGRLIEKTESAATTLAKREATLHTEARESKKSSTSSRVDKARFALSQAQSDLRTRLDTVPPRFSDADFENAVKLLPESRGRQPRTFPSLALTDPVVHLIWPEAAADFHKAALDRLASRLIYIGHSSSFVHARWTQAAPEATWIPHDQGELILRTPSPGQLDRLQVEFKRHRGVEPRILPFRAQRYRATSDIREDTRDENRHFNDRNWIILRRTGGPALPITRTADAAMAVRGALLRHADSPLPEALSGHSQDGQPSRAPHLILQPLPHVGHLHADGRIMGIALIIPTTVSKEDRAAILGALARWEVHARKENGQFEDDAPTLTLGLGDGVEVEMERHIWGEPTAAALKSGTWCAKADEWLSVTPVALDRNPGDLAHADTAKRDLAYHTAAEIIARSCENVGLPLPIAVSILPSGTWPGGARADRFPAFPRKRGKIRRVKVHARISFAEEISGPVILGAGRFTGLGLFRPVLPERRHD